MIATVRVVSFAAHLSRKRGTMGRMQVLFVLLAALAGSLIPVQAGVNASLRDFFPHPIFAAITNFLVGFTLLSISAIFMQATPPSFQAISKVPWWCWFGGSMGACLVLAGIFLSHRLGAGTFIACIILGQLTASVICDHFGLIGFPVHHVSLQRIVGIGLLAGGVALIRTS
jgi:bacterial/archaeal transporter family-2 protein